MAVAAAAARGGGGGVCGQWLRGHFSNSVPQRRERTTDRLIGGRVDESGGESYRLCFCCTVALYLIFIVVQRQAFA